MFQILTWGSGGRFGHGVTDCTDPQEEYDSQDNMKTAIWRKQT